MTPAKIAPVSRISAAVRAEDRRKAEKVRASAVFSALGDGAWVSETQEVAMAVEEEVVVKAEEAPVQFKGSVRFEIKNQRAAPHEAGFGLFPGPRGSRGKRRPCARRWRGRSRLLLLRWWSLRSSTAPVAYQRPIP